jgi:hypothetical protein
MPAAGRAELTTELISGPGALTAVRDGVQGQQSRLLVTGQMLQDRGRGDLRIALTEGRDQFDMVLLAPLMFLWIWIQATPADPDVTLRCSP